MQLGMVGLGRMGANLVRRLMRDGHTCVVYDVSADAVKALEAEGATGAASLEEFVAKLEVPRAAWVMVPAAYTGDTVEKLASAMSEGDIIIDGGNSYYRDDIHRAAELQDQGDPLRRRRHQRGRVRPRAGLLPDDRRRGRRRRHLDPIFKTIAPGVEAAPRSEGRTGRARPRRNRVPALRPQRRRPLRQDGAQRHRVRGRWPPTPRVWPSCTRPTSGSVPPSAADAETTPLSNPEYYQYDIDTTEVAEVWRRGSVISSWLLDLTAHALHEDPKLAGFAGRVSDSGEGRWTVMAAIDEAVPAHVLTAALYERFSSRGEADFADRILSAMRKEFGGHAEQGTGS